MGGKCLDEDANASRDAKPILLNKQNELVDTLGTSIRIKTKKTEWKSMRLFFLFAGLAVAFLLAGCVVSLSGVELSTTKAKYAANESIHVLSKGDGLKYAWQGSNITEFYYYKQEYRTWEAIDTREAPGKKMECLPSGTLIERYEFRPPLASQCRRLFTYEYAWDGKVLFQQQKTCGGKEYTAYERKPMYGKYKAVLRYYNDAACLTLNGTREVEFEILEPSN